MTPDFDLIVVGEGFAGLSCAAEAARLGLKVATFEAEFFGGLVVNVNELERFDEAAGLSGMDHAALLARDNGKAGVKSTNAAVEAVRAVDGGFEVDVAGGTKRARSVVLASGAHLKKLGVPGEDEYEGRGVSHCADCDAPMFAGAEAIVVGNNDWAVQDALILANECSTVHLLHEGGALQANDEYRERLAGAGNIRLWPSAKVDAVLGNAQGMTGVQMTDAQGSRELASAGLFALVGLEPNSSMAPEAVRRDAAGFLMTNDELQTDVAGLYAIGQVRAGFGGWLSDAVDEARRVAQTIRARLA